MKRKQAQKVTDEPKPPSEDYDEQEPLLKAVGKKKRVVGKYKPSRHSR
jgi:hypothetical protein